MRLQRTFGILTRPAKPSAWLVFVVVAGLLADSARAAQDGRALAPAAALTRPALETSASKRAAYFRWRRDALQTLAAVAEALARAAAGDCAAYSAQAPMIAGLVIDQPDQYQSEDLARVGLNPGDDKARFLVVVPGSAPARAGLLPDDRLALPIRTATRAPGPTFAGVDAAIAVLGEARQHPSADGKWHIAIVRQGAPRDIAVAAEPVCAAWVDLRQSDDLRANSNRTWIQFTDGLMRAIGADRDAVAFVVAHEMTHQLARLAGGPHAACSTGCEMAIDGRALAIMAAAGFDRQGALRALRPIAAHGGFGFVLDGRAAGLAARIGAIERVLARPEATCSGTSECRGNETPHP